MELSPFQKGRKHSLGEFDLFHISSPNALFRVSFSPTLPRLLLHIVTSYLYLKFDSEALYSAW